MLIHTEFLLLTVPCSLQFSFFFPILADIFLVFHVFTEISQMRKKTVVTRHIHKQRKKSCHTASYSTTALSPLLMINLNLTLMDLTLLIVIDSNQKYFSCVMHLQHLQTPLVSLHSEYRLFAVSDCMQDILDAPAVSIYHLYSENSPYHFERNLS